MTQTEQLLERYLRKYGLRAVSPRRWSAANVMDSRGPHADHHQGFFNPLTREIVSTEQPYFGQSPRTLEEITQDVHSFAIAHGLTARISVEESWHCPGRTVLIEYRKNKTLDIPQSELRKMSDEELELLADEIKYVQSWRKFNRQTWEESEAEREAYEAAQKTGARQ